MITFEFIGGTETERYEIMERMHIALIGSRSYKDSEILISYDKNISCIIIGENNGGDVVYTFDLDVVKFPKPKGSVKVLVNDINLF